MAYLFCFLAIAYAIVKHLDCKSKNTTNNRNELKIADLQKKILDLVDEVQSKQLKNENFEKEFKEELSKKNFHEGEIRALQNSLEYESKNLKNLKKSYQDIKFEYDKYINEIKLLKSIDDLKKRESFLIQSVQDKDFNMSRLNTEISNLEKRIELHSVGYFHYPYKFEHMSKYKEALILLESRQRELINNGEDFSCNNKISSDYP